MKGLSRSKRLRISMATSFLLVLSIPVVMYALLTTDNFDTSSDAGVEIPIAYCTLSFPYVEPTTIESGKTVQIEINADSPNAVADITDILIKTSEDIILLKETYSEAQATITKVITFSSDNIGNIQILGQMTSGGINHPCIVEGVTNNFIRTQQVNTAPEFTTDSKVSAEPGNAITTNQSYKYELVATDIDGDDIEYSYSFTPNADWLRMSVVKGGIDGSLVLQFEGVTDVAASYLANVFIHDGYNQHLRSQSWVISVEPAENDTPVVTITSPPANTSVEQGENITVTWNATDLNQIVNYRLFYTQNPGNQNAWKPIDEHLSHKIGSYIFNTNSLNPGEYKFIIQAQDNQAPVAIGVGISEAFTVGEKPLPPEETPVVVDNPEPEPDDGVVIQEAQVVNISPSDGSTVTNARRTISATLVASDGAEIIKESIVFTLDGRDLTDKVEFSEISASEITVVYKPDEDYTEGEHKVNITYEDTNGNTTEKEWTFIVEPKEGDEDSGDSYKIFGFEIPKRTLWIVLIGLGIILLALIIPWLLYLAWRGNEEGDDTVYQLPPSKQSSVRNTITPTVYNNVGMQNGSNKKADDSKYFQAPKKLDEKKVESNNNEVPTEALSTIAANQKAIDEQKKKTEEIKKQQEADMKRANDEIERKKEAIKNGPDKSALIAHPPPPAQIPNKPEQKHSSQSESNKNAQPMRSEFDYVPLNSAPDKDQKKEVAPEKNTEDKKEPIIKDEVTMMNEPAKVSGQVETPKVESAKESVDAAKMWKPRVIVPPKETPQQSVQYTPVTEKANTNPATISQVEKKDETQHPSQKFVQEEKPDNLPIQQPKGSNTNPLVTFSAPSPSNKTEE